MSTPCRIDHDIHVHTFLSSCSKDPDAVPEKMLEAAAVNGLRTVGFADHLWDAGVPGASDWYRPQDMQHIARIRAQLPADTRGVRVLLGCETEYIGNGTVGISPTAAAQLDFVLVPHSHFHMEGFVRPATVQQPDEIAALMQQRFAEAIELEVTTGIAHPFLPCTQREHTDEIIQAIPDSAFSDLFGRAAERGVSIEITAGAFPSLGSGETGGWHDSTFMRMYRLAAASGCVFHCASDTHNLQGMGRTRRLQPFVDELGLTQEQFHPLVRQTG